MSLINGSMITKSLIVKSLVIKSQDTNGSWYNLTTGVITCGAIIPSDEVIECL